MRIISGIASRFEHPHRSDHHSRIAVRRGHHDPHSIRLHGIHAVHPSPTPVAGDLGEHLPRTVRTRFDPVVADELRHDEERSGVVVQVDEILVDSNATVSGPVLVKHGAALRVDDATIRGTVLATSADIRGMLAVTGTTGPVVIDASTVRGLVSISDSAGGVAITGNELRGVLSCSGNDPAPTGSENTVQGVALGQCEGF